LLFRHLKGEKTGDFAGNKIICHFNAIILGDKVTALNILFYICSKKFTEKVI
jgi:hypothetical protein